jgi:hypothetical protein
LVGGRLAVGLKDTALLYVSWKMAHSHRPRRILDHDPKYEKAVRTTS